MAQWENVIYLHKRFWVDLSFTADRSFCKETISGSEVTFMNNLRSLIYYLRNLINKNQKKDGTLPCGTTELTSIDLEITCLILSTCVLTVRINLNHSCNFPLNINFLINKEWFTESRALEKIVWNTTIWLRPSKATKPDLTKLSQLFLNFYLLKNHVVRLKVPEHNYSLAFWTI